MGVVMGLLKRTGLSPASTDFNLTCSLHVDVRLNLLEELKDAITKTRVAEASEV
jgi:hypothetical protein